MGAVALRQKEPLRQERAPAPEGSPDAAVARRLLAAVPRQMIVVWVGVAVLSIISAGIYPQTFSRSVLSSLLPVAGVLAIASIGQALVVATGGFDLSIPAVITLMGVLLLRFGSSGPSAFALCLAAGAAVGLLNGLFTTYLGLNSLVVTLAVGLLASGVALLFQGQALSVGSLPSSLESWLGSVAGVSEVVFVAVGIAVGLALLGRWSVIGRRFVLCAVSEAAATLRGLPARRYRSSAYVASGVLAALAGIVLSLVVKAPDLTLGDPYELSTIVAVILGGAVLTGSRVSMAATLGGAVLLALLDQDLASAGAGAGVQSIVQGAVLLGAVGLATVVHWQRRRP